MSKMYYYICKAKEDGTIILATHTKFEARAEAEKYLGEGKFLIKAGERYFD